jgi:hypothetical protein
MITVEGANAYFADRTMGAAWSEYTFAQQESAIIQAKRDLSRALGRAMKEDEKPYQFGDRLRDEYAVYEQALYTLLRDVQPEKNGSMVPALELDEKQENKYTLSKGRGKWSEEALAWLGTVARVEIVMG